MKKSYYRLSGYWYPLLSDKPNHIFKPGPKFEIAYEIYLFDRYLRQLVVNELEKIEIAFRAKMIYIFSHQFGPFWYTDSANFKSAQKHSEPLSKITSEYHRSDAQFIKAFKEKYSDPLPPSWTVFEIVSFGSVSHLYFGLDDACHTKSKNFIYCKDILKIVTNWLHFMMCNENARTI